MIESVCGIRPTCDHCGQHPEDSIPDDWNGDTGNHRSCEWRVEHVATFEDPGDREMLTVRPVAESEADAWLEIRGVAVALENWQLHSLINHLQAIERGDFVTEAAR